MENARNLPKGVVPSILKAVQILDTLAMAKGPMTLAELTQRLELPKSSMLALCTSLTLTGMLSRLDSGAYHLGTHLLDLSHAYLGSIDLTKEFVSTWDSLAMPPGEGIVLGVLDATDVVYVACRNSDSPLGVTYRIGMRLPANCTATGKALLSTLPDERVRTLYRNKTLDQLTPHSHVTLKALLKDLHATRLRGYAIDDEETREGMCCFGAPVFDSSGSYAIAAVAVSTLKRPGESGGKPPVTEAVLDFARILSKRLGAKGKLL
ncbi:MAG: IclR family transcriptional regulator [Sterolibacterium sp.]